MQVIRESYRAVDCDGRSQQLKPCNVELAMIVHDFMVLAQHKNLPRIRFVDVTTQTCIDTVEGNSRVPHRCMVASMDEEEYVHNTEWLTNQCRVGQVVPRVKNQWWNVRHCMDESYVCEQDEDDE